MAQMPLHTVTSDICMHIISMADRFGGGKLCMHNLLYKDEMVSVCPSVTQLTQSSQRAQL